MARKLFLFIFLVFISLSIASCSSSNSSDDDIDEDVIAELDDSEEGDDDDEGFDDEGDEDFDEDVADSDEDSEEGFDDEEDLEEDLEEVADSEEDFEESDEDLEDEALEEEVADDQTVEEELEEDLTENLDEEVAAGGDEGGEAVDVVDISYLASKNGGTVEVKTTGDATFVSRVNNDTNQFILEIQQANLKESLKRPYIMKEFDGPFKAVNAYQSSGSSTARIVVQMNELNEPVVQKEGNSILIIPSQGMTVAQEEVAPEEPEQVEEPEEVEVEDEPSYDTQAAEKDEKILAARTLDEFLTGASRFYGRPISIQVKDADIRDVINFIAEESGINLVMSDGVSGKVTLKLRQIPWDQALIIVMRSSNLGYIRQGSVLRISPLETLQAESAASAKIVESQKKLTPLKVKVMPIGYAKVDDLPKQILPFLTKDRGKVVGDTRTSSLIITDTENQLIKIERLIKELDIPPAQVMIEGKIIEATESFSKSMGVNWSFSGSALTISDSGGVDGGPLDLSSTLAVRPVNATALGGAAGVMTLNVGTLDFLGDLDATLALAENDNLARVISSPRIVTINKEKAEISQEGEVVSISSQISAEGVITRASKNSPVKLSLTVQPQITSEGSVIMDVAVEREFPGPVVDQETLARAINKRKAKTKVLVKNGQTAVIGGVFQSDETTSETGIPGLRNVPVLGWLFKSRLIEKNKNELMIFLTPRVLNAKDQSVSEEEV